MRFEHAPRTSFEDFASGNILHSAPGYPAFPIRLTLELFERARLLTGKPRVGVWDPMCGAGGIVTTLGLLRPEAITHILATDINEDATTLAAKNLQLLSDHGMRQRAKSLAEHSTRRAETAERLRAQRQDIEPIVTEVRVLDATRTVHFRDTTPRTIDIVIADLPYGKQTTWTSDARSPQPQLLASLQTQLPSHSIIVLCSGDRADFKHMPKPLRAFRHGHRTIKFYRTEVA